MVDQQTASAVLLACGAASWGITVLVRRAVDRAELIRNCQHVLWSDPCGGWNATMRCALCPYQRPDLEAVARYDAERLARRCPHCGERLEDG